MATTFCKGCPDHFWPANEKRKYCSEACRLRAKARRNYARDPSKTINRALASYYRRREKVLENA